MSRDETRDQPGRASGMDGVGLVETLRLDGGVPQHLDEHLDRLARSAGELGFQLEVAAVRARLLGHPGDGLLRVELHSGGEFDVTLRPLVPTSLPVRLALADLPAGVDRRTLVHKTTCREHLVAARQQHPRVDDVLLCTPGGLVTESTVANLAVLLGGRWVTPPVSDGLLPGVGRRLALEQGRVVERSVHRDELVCAEELALVSSARGWRPAVLLD